jgi:predicted nucleic acid-binding Zn ribbon protein
VQTDDESQNMSEETNEAIDENEKDFVTDNASSSLAGALDALLDRLGAESTTAITGVFGEWPKIVGEQVAQHVTPIKLERGRLIVEIDDPSWATQMRFLEPQLIEKLNAATTSTIIAIEVRVKRNPRNR